MSTAIITIQTQFQENYSQNDTPRWKNKGGVEFKVTINSDLLFYGTSDILPHLKTLIELKCNEHFNYIYLEHTVAFTEPESLDTKALEALVRKEYGDAVDLVSKGEPAESDSLCYHCDEPVEDTSRSYCSDQCESAARHEMEQDGEVEMEKDVKNGLYGDC